jgi:toxin FitB
VLPAYLTPTAGCGFGTFVTSGISWTTTRSIAVPEHRLALLDTSCVIEFPQQLEELADTAAVSVLTIAELAYGIHHDDPLVAAAREARYREVLGEFDPVPYSARAAHLYGAIAASVRKSGRNPRPRRIDLMLASVAAELDAVLLTRNPDDFIGIGNIAHVIAV